MPKARIKPTPSFKRSWEHYNGTELRPVTESILNFIEDNQPIPTDLMTQYNKDLVAMERERLEEIKREAEQRLRELEQTA